jgi:hypothetical protein
VPVFDPNVFDAGVFDANPGAIADTTTTSDTLARSVGHFRTASDTTAVSESIVHSAGASEIADTVTTSDSIASARGVVRALSEDLTGAEVISDDFDRGSLGAGYDDINDVSIVSNALEAAADTWGETYLTASVLPLPATVAFDFYVPATIDGYHGYQLDASGRYLYVDNDDYFDVGVGSWSVYSSPLAGGLGAGFGFAVTPDTWYRAKGYLAASAGDTFHLKVWERDDPEPDWQYSEVYGFAPASPGDPRHYIYLDAVDATEPSRMDNIEIRWQPEMESVARALVMTRQPADASDLIEFVLPYATVSPTAEEDIATGYAPVLTAPIDATQTTITVSPAAPASMVVPFVVALDGEQMLVTAVAGGTWTVVRNYNGSTASTHASGAVARPALVNVKIGGVDYTAYISYERSRFSSGANGQAGTAEIWIRDLEREHAITTGAEIVVTFRGIRKWGGYVAQVQRSFVFDYGSGLVGDEPRWLTIQAVDYNILFNKRAYYDKADMNDAYVARWPNGTHDNVVIGNMVSRFLDLAGDGLSYDIRYVGTPALPTVSCNPDAPDEFSVGTAGWMWGEAMNSIVSQTGALFYIDPDKVFRYVDDSTAQSAFGYDGISDAPGSGGYDTIGYRDFEWDEDAAKLINDQIVWGAGQGSNQMVVARATDEDSIAEHGLWQGGEARFDMYCQESVDQRAETWLYGSPQNRRGHASPRNHFKATVFEPYFRVADVIRVQSTEHGFDGLVPVRTEEVTFPTPWDIKCVLTISHELDAPWQTHEFWIPTFDFTIQPLGPGGGINLPPFPTIGGWPDPDPCLCLDTPCVVDHFGRVAGSFGVADSGQTWSTSGTGGTTGSDAALHGSPSFTNASTSVVQTSATQAEINSIDCATLPVGLLFTMRYVGTWNSEYASSLYANESTGLFYAPGYGATGGLNAGSFYRQFVTVQLKGSSIPMHRFNIYNADGSLWISRWYEGGAAGQQQEPVEIGTWLQPGEVLNVRTYADSDRVYIRVWRAGEAEPAFWHEQTNAVGSTYGNLLRIASTAQSKGGHSSSAFTMYIDDVELSAGDGDCNETMGSFLGLPNFAAGPDLSLPLDILVHASGYFPISAGPPSPRMWIEVNGDNYDTYALADIDWSASVFASTIHLDRVDLDGSGESATDFTDRWQQIENPDFWVRLRVEEDHTYLRIWLDADPEPGTWLLDFAVDNTVEPLTSFDIFLDNGSEDGAYWYLESVEINGVTDNFDRIVGDDLGWGEGPLGQWTTTGADDETGTSVDGTVAKLVYDSLEFGGNEVVMFLAGGSNPCADGPVVEPPAAGETDESLIRDPEPGPNDGAIFRTSNQYQRGSTEVWVDGVRIRLGSDYLEYPRTKRIEILDHIDLGGTGPEDPTKVVRIRYVIWLVEDPAPDEEPL